MCGRIEYRLAIEATTTSHIPHVDTHARCTRSHTHTQGKSNVHNAFTILFINMNLLIKNWHIIYENIYIYTNFKFRFQIYTHFWSIHIVTSQTGQHGTVSNSITNVSVVWGRARKHIIQKNIHSVMDLCVFDKLKFIAVAAQQFYCCCAYNTS